MTDESLRKPKRIRGTTKETMDIVMLHLYPMRIATIRQLLKLIIDYFMWDLGLKDEVKEPAFRRQLERYVYISKKKMALTEYIGDVKGWVDASNVVLYHLDKEIAVQFESALSKDYYSSNSDRSPVPERSTANHHILMSELYVKMYCEGLGGGLGFNWLPSVGFNVELAKLRDEEAIDTSMRVPVLSGAVSEKIGLWGFGVYDGEAIRGFKRSLSMYIPQRSLFDYYNLLIFVTRDCSGDAQRRLVDIPDNITIRNPELPAPRREPLTLEEMWKQRDEKENKLLDRRKEVHILPYEWAVRNPDVVKYVLRDARERIMERLLKPSIYLFGAYLSNADSGHFEWSLTETNGESVLIDTTIGKTPAEIMYMIRSRERCYKRILVPTEEEKETWKKFSEKFLVDIDFKVVDPSHDDIFYRREYEDLFGPPITTPDEFDEALDKWLLRGIS